MIPIPKKLLHDKSENLVRYRSVLNDPSNKRISPLIQRKSISTSIIKPRPELSSINSNNSLGILSPLAAQAQALYIAKCSDLFISPVPDQERRFTQTFLQNAQKRRLSIQDNKLSTESSVILSKILEKCAAFAYIDLSKNKLSDEGMKKIAKSLLSNIDLVSLNISSNDLTPAGSKEVLEVLAVHSTLFSLDFSSHQFVFRNKIGACSALTHILKSPTLCHLNLSGTALGNEGLKHVIAGLNMNKVLKELNLSNNSIKGVILREFVQALVNSKLESVDFSFNLLEEVAIEELSVFFAGFYGYSTLCRLSLARNIIPNAAAYRLFEVLVKESCLEFLNIEGNNLNGNLDVLQKFIRGNKRLKSLNLSNCSLKIESFCKLCEGLCDNFTLETLIISGNSCKDIGAQYLSKALLNNFSLITLDISSNQIQNPGGILIAGALKSNKSLKSLSLNDNELKDEVGECFFTSFTSNFSLTKLKIELNPMSTRYSTDIQKYLDRNKDIEQKKQLGKLNEMKIKLDAGKKSAEDLSQRLHINKIEKIHIEGKIGGYYKRLQFIRMEEDEKLEELKQELKVLKDKNVEFSKTLFELNGEIRHFSMFEDRSVKEYEGKVREVDTVVKKLEIRSNMDIENILASHLVESKKQFQAMYENLILQLASANKEKNYAAGATERLKAKLEEKRSLKPGKIAITRQKTPTKIKAKFLSSEKLRNLTKSKTPLLRVLKKPEP